jgi:hypothetical protein
MPTKAFLPVLFSAISIASSRMCKENKKKLPDTVVASSGDLSSVLKNNWQFEKDVKEAVRRNLDKSA